MDIIEIATAWKNEFHAIRMIMLLAPSKRSYVCNDLKERGFGNRKLKIKFLEISEPVVQKLNENNNGWYFNFGDGVWLTSAIPTIEETGLLIEATVLWLRIRNYHPKNLAVAALDEQGDGVIYRSGREEDDIESCRVKGHQVLSRN